MGLKAIIFDLDGTLIDSAVMVLSVVNRIRRERSFPALSMGEVRPHLSKGGLRLVAECLAAAASNEEEDLRIFRSYYASTVHEEDVVFQDMRVLLASLKKEGYGLGVCTNKPRVLCTQVLAHTGLVDYFTSIVSAGEILPAKPDPTAYLQCCRELGVEAADTLMVGDSEVDEATARSAGAAFILVTYGYPVGTVDTIRADAKCEDSKALAQAIRRIAGSHR